MKAVRFRCPKCRTPYSAVAAKAGQAFVCTTCFGPMIVPEGAGAPAQEVPIAGPARVTPPSTGARPVAEVRPSSRPVDRRALVALGMIAAAGLAAGLLRSRAEGRRAPEAPTTPPVAAAAPEVIAPESAPAPEPALAAVPTPPVEPTPPVARAEAPTAPNDADRPLVIRRRQKLGQDALRRQLAELPEMVVDDRTEAVMLALHHVPPPSSQQGPQGALALTFPDRERLRKIAVEEARRHRAQGGQAAPRPEPTPKPAMHVARVEGAPRDMLAMIGKRQPELTALPWRMGDECHLDQEAAEDLQAISRGLRTLLVQSTPQGDTRPDADLLRAAMLEESAEEPAPAQGEASAALQRKIAKINARRPPKAHIRYEVPAAIPALLQLLMAERSPVRLVLVDVLGKIPGREAVKALARLSMFDLAPEVRERALLALRARLAGDYRPALVEGLRYPWPPVADHAAEALVALEDREAVPGLVGLLDRPDPRAPRTEVRDGKPVSVAATLVQVNHLQNCVPCHAPSGHPTLDMVRGRVPDDSLPLPPPVEYYASSSPGLFVRAEVTYLRQDFSVTQPVEQSGPWPAHQRYDYLVADRPVPHSARSPEDGPGYPQRESVLFALRELTGKDLGAESAGWKALAPAWSE